MSTIKVDSIKSSDGNTDLLTLSNGSVSGVIGGRRNLIINGAMQVSQRGTSFTANGSFVADRFRVYRSGAAGYTCTQADITSGDPFDLGFRSSVKMQNTTPDTASNSYYQVETTLEDQDMATRGWNYKSASSNVTFSFWAKASVSQDYWVVIRASGTQHFGFSYPLVADTWTKVTKVIPGNTNIVFDNDNSAGLRVVWIPYYGTDYTSASFVEDTWASSDESSYTSDIDSTWVSTTNATFEITGVQLEVGSVATPFEHRSYGEELALCQRYYCKTYDDGTAPGTATQNGCLFNSLDGTHGYGYTGQFNFPVNMRATPSITIYSITSGTAGKLNGDSSEYNAGTNAVGANRASIGVSNISIGTSVYIKAHATADAEL
jgi:hypothetical protein